MEKNKEHLFHVEGMHCKSCVLVTENKIGEVAEVASVKTDLHTQTVRVVGDFGNKSEDEIAAELTHAVEQQGYKISVERKESEKNKRWSEFLYAAPIAFGFALLFILMQKMGLVNLIGAGRPTYGTAFMVGVVASLSSCMAVVGGLVLSMSATFAKSGDRIKPQVLFHLGRLIGFFVLGGLIGALGAAVALNGFATFVISMIIGLVMLIMGINLLEIFDLTKKLQPAMPKFISKHVYSVTRLNHVLTPSLVGIVTFFLPCGFTQSMQVYALGTGSFLTGALTMFIFALGTLPVLSLLSFSSLSIIGSNKSGVFFRAAGLIVIMFALFNIINGLVAYGIMRPIFSF